VWWSLIGIELWLGTAASSLLALLSAQCGTDEDPWRLCPEPEITTGTRQTSEMVQRHTTLQVNARLSLSFSANNRCDGPPLSYMTGNIPAKAHLAQVLDENPGNLLLHIAVPSACSRHQEHCASKSHGFIRATFSTSLFTSFTSELCSTGTRFLGISPVGPAHAVTVSWRLSELGTSGSSTGARVCEAREHGFSQWNVPPDPGAPNSSPVLPPCAAAFVGEWMQQRTENYIEYLREVRHQRKSGGKNDRLNSNDICEAETTFGGVSARMLLVHLSY